VQIYDHIDAQMPIASSTWSIPMPTLTGTTTNMALVPDALLGSPGKTLLQGLITGGIAILYLITAVIRANKYFS